MSKKIKDWKMATIWGILYWALIFVVVSVMMLALPRYEDWMTLITNPFLVIFCAWMYFKGSGKANDGLALGIYWVLIGVALDAFVTAPLFTRSYTFFSNWKLWFGWAETVIFPELLIRYLRK